MEENIQLPSHGNHLPQVQHREQRQGEQQHEGQRDEQPEDQQQPDLLLLQLLQLKLRKMKIQGSVGSNPVRFEVQFSLLFGGSMFGF